MLDIITHEPFSGRKASLRSQQLVIGSNTNDDSAENSLLSNFAYPAIWLCTKPTFTTL